MTVSHADWSDALEKVLKDRDPDEIRSISITVMTTPSGAWWMQANIVHTDGSKTTLI